MNIGNKSVRLRGSGNAKKGNSYTFKNSTAPRMMPRFLPPATPLKNYGAQNLIKTPIISSTSLFGVPNKDDCYGPVVEPMEQDNWGTDFFDNDENGYKKNSSNGQHKNVFSFKSNVNHQKSSNPYYGRGNTKTPALYNCNLDQSTPLRQTILSPETPNGFGYKMPETEKCLPKAFQETVVKPFPKWNPCDSNQKQKAGLDNKEQHFPRIFSVTVDKLLSCPKSFDCGNVIFELFGILESCVNGMWSKSKTIQLKSQKLRSTLTCIFYEIDRQLPKLVPGQWHRCIVIARTSGEYQCVTIRSATVNELKYLDQLVISSSRSMAMLLKANQ